MKKTLITTLLGLGFVANASAASNFDIDTAAKFNSLNTVTTSTDTTTELGTLTYSAPTAPSSMGRITTDTAEALYSGSNNQRCSSITFSLNIDAIKTAVDAGLTANVVLVQFDWNTMDNGIMLTTSGSLQQFYYDGQGVMTAKGSEYSYDSVKALNTFTMPSGDSAAILTAVTLQKNLYAMKEDGSYILPSGGNYSSNNSVLEGIDVNTAFINDVMITPLTLNPEGAAAAAKAIPEPATATLSLLALAGLAARRRRK